MDDKMIKAIKNIFCKKEETTKEQGVGILDYLQDQDRNSDDGQNQTMNPMRTIIKTQPPRGGVYDSYSPEEDAEDFANMNEEMLAWFTQNGEFLGFQKLAIISMNPLISKGCSIVAKDAVKNWFKLKSNLTEEQNKIIVAKDKAFDLRKNLIEFIRDGKKLGLRILYFKVDSEDKDYYKKPFNLDGVTEGSFKGIVQVEPIWCAPSKINTNILSSNFYEPTAWIIGGKEFHHSHLIIYRGDSVPDILKPTYLYGGMSTTQKVWRAVFQADTIANEAPLLAKTKRLRVLKTDLERLEAVKGDFTTSMKKIMKRLNNFGFFVIDKGEESDIQQLDTSLTDFDVLLNNHLQLCASIFNIPATKLLGTSPKGFGASGEYEMTNYAEELESIQHSDIMPFVDRYYQIMLMSEFGQKIDFEIIFNSVYSDTELEKAQLTQVKEQAMLTKAQRLDMLFQAGAITSDDIAEAMREKVL